MTRINLLDRQVADMIAAGEVVERPASVIKELVENSIDAGATSVTVEIQNGGMSYIRVADNGCGMSAEDAKTCFLRHATSKLHDARGLEAIGTLGFRGEALAAISSVSHVELLTREKGAPEGVSVTLDGGADMSVTPIGCPEGTTIIIRGLFYNVPARLKFMKSDKTEGASCSAAVLRCALSHPEVSVRYIKDGAEQLHTPGDSRLDSCIYSVLGRDFALGLKKTEGSDDGVSVTGYVSAPHAARGNRSYQFFYVNGRYIKSKTLQAALEQAYRNTLFTGRFPSCVLYITVSAAAVDVNVHPTKTEVRFLYEKKVFDVVYYAVLGALNAEEKAPALEIKAKKPIPESPKPQSSAPVSSSGGFRRMDASSYRDLIASAEEKNHAERIAFRQQPIAPTHIDRAPKPSYMPPAPSNVPAPEAKKSPAPQQVSMPLPRQEQITEIEKPAEIIEEPVSEKKPFRVIGEAMDTYIIVEQGDSLWLIDKHAAHERANFDRLKDISYEPMVQSLLTPIICRMGREDTQLIAESADILHKFGITAEPFGDDTVAVREIPSELNTSDVEAALSEICGKLRRGCSDDSQRIDAIMHTMACKAAIKSGMKNDISELYGLAEKVMSGEIKYCPHGRPVAIELTRHSLDRSFRRI